MADFEKLTASKLHSAAVVPQALDNQWVPSLVMANLARNGIGISGWKDRERTVLREWRRALVYAPQIIVNRAYFFNNPVIAKDYQGTSSALFSRLLNEKVLVNFLLDENSPDDHPQFDLHQDTWNRWIRLVNETKMACVKLDWLSQKKDMDNISSLYHSYIQNLNMPDRASHLMQAQKIPSSMEAQYRATLLDVARFAFDTAAKGESVKRNELYKKYVCVDGSKISDGLYDWNKPFAAQLKEIFDLRYTVNLPDAVGRYAFTPKGSPGRELLGEISPAGARDLLEEKGIDALVDTLRRMEFSRFSEGLYMKGLELLSLDDVLSIRKTEAWTDYAASFNQLISDPFRFGENAEITARKFASLNQVIAGAKERAVQGKTDKILNVARPIMSIVLYISSAIISLKLDPDDIGKILVNILVEKVPVGAAPLAMNLIMKTKAKADIGVSLNFLRKKVANGRDSVEHIIEVLRSDPRFRTQVSEGQSFHEVAEQSRADACSDEIL